MTSAAHPRRIGVVPPPDLPFLTHLDEWHHRQYNNYSADRAPNGHRPSSYETFPLLTGVRVSGDPTRYRPTLPPTTHRSNRPEAGAL